MRKRNLVSILFAACTLTGYAQNQLNIWQQSGSVVSYSFSEKPRLVFESETLKLTASGVTVEYPVADIRKYSFENDPLSVGRVSARLSDGGDVSVYTPEGILLKRVPAGKDGKTAVSIDDLPRGVYVVKSKSSTFKIMKQ
ncbi:MAG: T9SS type A sorting domain-containing protein [Bacteroidaceae bacterium]|nr:T9SS type A sorting domain-containing protein [Bacteroidaceae bacterium]